MPPLANTHTHETCVCILVISVKTFGPTCRACKHDCCGGGPVATSQNTLLMIVGFVPLTPENPPNQRSKLVKR
eukprot:5099076-Amphidinium_carterae.1